MVKSICCSNKEHKFSDPEIYLPLPDGKQLSLILAFVWPHWPLKITALLQSTKTHEKKKKNHLQQNPAGIDLTRKPSWESYRLKKRVKDNTTEWKTSCLWIGRINVVKNVSRKNLQILCTCIKILMAFFTSIKNILKVIWNCETTGN